MGRPLLQVGQVHPPVGVDAVRHFDPHVVSGFDVAQWGLVGVGVQRPHCHRNVVGVPCKSKDDVISIMWFPSKVIGFTFIIDGYYSIEDEEVSLPSIIEGELLHEGLEAAVLVECS